MPRPGRSTALAFAFLLPFAAATAAQAQSGAAPTASVKVAGKRESGADPRVIYAAKSKVLSRNYASSCGYMSAFNPNEDDLILAYMQEFGNDGTLERLRENSPDGDVSSAALSSSFDDFFETGTTKDTAGCKAADRNFASARNRIVRKDKTLGEAFAAFDTRDYARAKTLAETGYKKAGFGEAAVMLGKIHLYGLGTKQDTKEAVYWFKRVAEDRYDPMRDKFVFDPAYPEMTNERIEAVLSLAKIYTRGIGTAPNPAEAMKWYQEAVKIGFVPANNTIGMAYLNGYGAPVDAKKAQAHFTLAAEVGYAQAQYNLGKLYYNGDEGVRQDLTMAGAWFGSAAKTGHAGALFAAGRMFDLGKGVPADQNKAIVYYKDAAKLGDPEAQHALATYFYTGEIVAKDLATARRLFAAAARQGQPDAMFNLAVMSVNGEGGATDLSSAYVWFSLANKLGNENADAARKTIAGKLNADEMKKANSILSAPQAAGKAGS